jgi:chromosome partitioning protein
MKQLLILGPKGGVGKTTLARNLAVAAARAGLSVGTMDLDGQGTLDQWCNYRPEHQPPVISYTHSYMALDEKGIRKIPGLDLLVIDTPASVEFNLKALGALIKYADYIVIPSGVRGEEMDSLRGVLEMLRTQRTARYCVVFNGVKPKQIEAVTAQSALAMVPDIDLAPIPIQELAEVYRTYDAGLGILDLKEARTTEAFEKLWTLVADRLGLAAKVAA